MAERQECKVSVIIPVYNDERYIRHCVDSIIGQTYRDLEILLVDDASSDGSLAICKEYAANDSRVKVIRHEQNCGLSKSRETGYTQASGEWICFMDHDDCMNSRAVEYLMAYADESTDIVAARYKNIITKNFEQYVWEDAQCTKAHILSHDRAVNMLGSFGQHDVPECLWGKIYRRTLFEQTEFCKYKKAFPLLYFEDVLLTSSLVKACRKMMIINQYIYIHRVDFDSVSMSPRALEFNLQTARTADIVIARLEEPYANKAYAKVLQNYLLVFSKNWYLVWWYHKKDQKLLDEMEGLFYKYYDSYKRLNVQMPIVPDLCIRLFRLNKVLFCIVVCRVWFECVSKIRYCIKSK
ncbi:MAG: glycosyltransferase [Lachnospiraceae bacterium]|nr:glycosyltransferase [Lachnospiraceae bacterium]